MEFKTLFKQRKKGNSGSSPNRKDLWSKLGRNASLPQLSESFKGEEVAVRDYSSTYSLPKFVERDRNLVDTRVFDVSTDPGVTIDNTTTTTKVSPSAPLSVQNLFYRFPYEIQLRIMSMLSPKMLLDNARVSQHFRRLCRDGSLWKSINSDAFQQPLSASQMLSLIGSAGMFLKTLTLMGCVQISATAFTTALAPVSFSNLETIVLIGCHRLSSANLCHLIYSAPRLRKLDLEVLDAVDEAVCGAIADASTLLEELNLNWCRNMCPPAFAEIVMRCVYLRSISIMQSSKIPHTALKALGRLKYLEELILDHADIHERDLQIMFRPTRRRDLFPQLRRLSLSNCTRLAGEALSPLIKRVSRLEHLSLINLNNLEEPILVALLATCPMLKSLDLCDSYRTSNATLRAASLNDCSQTLVSLDLGYCYLADDAGIADILTHCPNLQSLDVSNTHAGDYVPYVAARVAADRCDRSNATTLQLNAFDCPNVTWLGIAHVLFVNVYLHSKRRSASAVRLRTCFAWQLACDQVMRQLDAGETILAWATALQLGLLIGRRMNLRSPFLPVEHYSDKIEELPAIMHPSVVDSFSERIQLGRIRFDNFLKYRHLASSHIFAAAFNIDPLQFANLTPVMRVIEVDPFTRRLREFPADSDEIDQTRGSRDRGRTRIAAFGCIVM